MKSATMSCVKNLMFAFNFIFVICGIVLMAVGGIVLTKLKSHEYFYGGYLGAPVVLIILGVFVFLLAFLACCGAIRENKCMVMTYAVLLFLIVIVEVGATAAAYVYRSQIEDVIRDTMSDSLDKYRNDSIAQSAWDDVQLSMQCCGYQEGAKDFLNRTIPIPKSCCGDKLDTCTEDKAFKKNCFERIQDFFKDNILQVGATGIAIACIELLGIIFACCLASAIDKKYESV